MTSADQPQGEPMCDHGGECAPDRGGCRFIQFERAYDICVCGGWDERFTSRDRAIRLAGRSNHLRGCSKRDVPAPLPSPVVEDTEALAEALFWQKYRRAQVPESFDQSRLTELREVAKHVVASDWLRARDAQTAARAERRFIECAAELVEELCPHEADEHAEGTCEVCDYAFALGAILTDDDPHPDADWLRDRAEGVRRAAQ